MPQGSAPKNRGIAVSRSRAFRMNQKLGMCLLANLLFLAVVPSARFVYAQNAPSKSVARDRNASGELELLPVQGNISMLAGAGGNITVQAGKDGILLVDTGLATTSDKVLEAIFGVKS